MSANGFVTLLSYLPPLPKIELANNQKNGSSSSGGEKTLYVDAISCFQGLLHNPPPSLEPFFESTTTKNSPSSLLFSCCENLRHTILTFHSLLVEHGIQPIYYFGTFPNCADSDSDALFEAKYEQQSSIAQSLGVLDDFCNNEQKDQPIPSSSSRGGKGKGRGGRGGRGGKVGGATTTTTTTTTGDLSTNVLFPLSRPLSLQYPLFSMVAQRVLQELRANVVQVVGPVETGLASAYRKATSSQGTSAKGDCEKSKNESQGEGEDCRSLGILSENESFFFFSEVTFIPLMNLRITRVKAKKEKAAATPIPSSFLELTRSTPEILVSKLKLQSTPQLSVLSALCGNEYTRLLVNEMGIHAHLVRHTHRHPPPFPLPKAAPSHARVVAAAVAFLMDPNHLNVSFSSLKVSHLPISDDWVIALEHTAKRYGWLRGAEGQREAEAEAEGEGAKREKRGGGEFTSPSPSVSPASFVNFPFLLREVERQKVHPCLVELLPSSSSSSHPSSRETWTSRILSDVNVEVPASNKSSSAIITLPLLASSASLIGADDLSHVFRQGTQLFSHFLSVSEQVPTFRWLAENLIPQVSRGRKEAATILRGQYGEYGNELHQPDGIPRCVVRFAKRRVDVYQMSAEARGLLLLFYAAHSFEGTVSFPRGIRRIVMSSDVLAAFSLPYGKRSLSPPLLMTVLSLRYLIGQGNCELQREKERERERERRMLEKEKGEKEEEEEEEESLGSSPHQLSVIDVIAILKTTLFLFALRNIPPHFVSPPSSSSSQQQQQQQQSTSKSNLVVLAPEAGAPWFQPFRSQEVQERAPREDKRRKQFGKESSTPSPSLFSSFSSPSLSSPSSSLSQKPNIPLHNSTTHTHFCSVLDHLSLLYPLIDSALQNSPSPLRRETYPPLFPSPFLTTNLIDGPLFAVLLREEQRKQHKYPQNQNTIPIPDGDVSYFSSLFEKKNLSLVQVGAGAGVSKYNRDIEYGSVEMENILRYIQGIFSSNYMLLYSCVFDVFSLDCLKGMGDGLQGRERGDKVAEEEKEKREMMMLKEKLDQQISLSSIMSKLKDGEITKEVLHPPYMPSDLPAAEHALTVYQHVKENDVTIVCGETGCGKSSYIPALLHHSFHLDAMMDALSSSSSSPSPSPSTSAPLQRRKARIYVTQPRRVAAVSLARRVSSLRGERVGEGAVGYLIGQDRSVSRKTEIFYVTVGWLVERVVHTPDFIRTCTHIVLDEVHERDVAADLLCLLVKRLLIDYKEREREGEEGIGSPPKIVVMSATFDGDLFANYFCPENPPNALHIGARRFPVDVFHLDEIHKFPYFSANVVPPRTLVKRAIDNIQSKMKTPEKIMADELYDLLSWLCKSLSLCHYGPSAVVEKEKPKETGICILVFFAGLADIEDAFERLSPSAGGSGAGGAGKMEVFALHSLLDRDQQMEVFSPVPEGVTRVILATNIAESSITLPSARYVVDFGLHKMLMPSNQFRGCQLLQLQWCSRASLVQRMGRTGRLMPGTVFRFFPRVVFDEVCCLYEEPEICRLSLSSTVLKLKLMCDSWSDGGDRAHREDHGEGEREEKEGEEREEEREKKKKNASFLPMATQALLEVMQPPSVAKITEGYEDLIDIGALGSLEEISLSFLTPRQKAHQLDHNTSVTPLGFFLSSLPLDLRLGRMVALGALLGVMPSSLIIACSIGIEDIFSQPYPLLFLGMDGHHQSNSNSSGTGIRNIESRNRDLVELLAKIERTRRVLDGEKMSDHLAVLAAIDFAVSSKFVPWKLMEKGFHSKRVYRLAQTAREVARHVCDKFPLYAEELKSLLNVLPEKRGASFSAEEGRQEMKRGGKEKGEKEKGEKEKEREGFFPRDKVEMDLLKFLVGVGLSEHLLVAETKVKPLCSVAPSFPPFWPAKPLPSPPFSSSLSTPSPPPSSLLQQPQYQRKPFFLKDLEQCIILSHDGSEEAALSSTNSNSKSSSSLSSSPRYVDWAQVEERIHEQFPKIVERTMIIYGDLAQGQPGQGARKQKMLLCKLSSCLEEEIEAKKKEKERREQQLLMGEEGKEVKKKREQKRNQKLAPESIAFQTFRRLIIRSRVVLLPMRKIVISQTPLMTTPTPTPMPMPSLSSSSSSSSPSLPLPPPTTSSTTNEDTTAAAAAPTKTVESYLQKLTVTFPSSVKWARVGSSTKINVKSPIAFVKFIVNSSSGERRGGEGGGGGDQFYAIPSILEQSSPSIMRGERITIYPKSDPLTRLVLLWIHDMRKQGEKEEKEKEQGGGGGKKKNKLPPFPVPRLTGHATSELMELKESLDNALIDFTPTEVKAHRQFAEENRKSFLSLLEKIEENPFVFVGKEREGKGERGGERGKGGREKNDVGIDWQRLYCSVCQVQGTSYVDMSSHSKGKAHAAKVSQSGFSSSSSQRNGFGGGKGGGGGGGGGGRERERERRGNEVVKPGGIGIDWKRLYCNVCGILGSSYADIKTHSLGRAHAARVKERETRSSFHSSHSSSSHSSSSHSSSFHSSSSHSSSSHSPSHSSSFRQERGKEERRNKWADDGRDWSQQPQSNGIGGGGGKREGREREKGGGRERERGGGRGGRGGGAGAGRGGAGRGAGRGGKGGREEEVLCCRLCNVSASSLANLEQHLNGEGHRKMLRKKGFSR